MTDDSNAKSEGVPHKVEVELTKRLKRQLENWREILIQFNSVLLWEKPYYPGIIFGSVTFFFTILWYFDPSVLTLISIFGIIACVFDYLVPFLSANVFDSNKWTGSKEREYEDVCRKIALTSLQSKCVWNYIRHIKESKPYMYVLCVLGTLICTAWAGNTFDNFFLIYFIVLMSLLMPGIKSQELVQENISKVQAILGSFIGCSSSGEKKKK